MESIRPSSSGYFPEVSDDLGREPGSPYPSQESLPADSYSDTPGSVDQLSQSHQETYLRAAHYTVVHARPGELVQHVQEGDKDGEPAFCVQAVGSYTDGGGELDKGVPHELQFISPDLSGAAYQLSASGEVYKLVVRETKPGEEVSEEQLAAHYSHQLLPDPLHQEAEPAAEPAVDHPTELQTVEKKLVLPLPPPPPSQTPSQPLPQSQSSQPPPPPPRTPHCLICDVPLTNHTVLDIFSNSTHQTSTTYAIKLRQITGHRASLAFHSEVLCESCASLLNVVDSFEARLREIQARLDDTRAEVRTKFGRTSARYDETLVPGPEVLDLDTGAVRSKKRRSGEEAKPTKKKARSKAALAVKDAAYKNKSKTNASDEGAAPKRPRPTRRAVERRRALTEAEGADPEEGADDLDDPSGPNYMELPARLESGAPADEEDEDEDDEDPEDEDTTDITDGRPVRVANMCTECGRLFINPMVLRVHQLAHREQRVQDPPVPPPVPPPSDDLIIPVLEMDYGTNADDVLAQAVQQMHGPGSPPASTTVTVMEQPAPPVEGADGTAGAGSGTPGAGTETPAPGQSSEEVQDVYKCDTCLSMFKSLQSLQRHHRKAHTQAVWRCFVCWQAVDSLRRMKRHVATHGERNSCAVCLMPFETKALLKLHVTRKHPETQVKNNYCELCHKHYDNQGFSEHARGVHGVGLDTSIELKCDQCDKVLPNSICLIRHMKVHKKSFNCQYCGKPFNNRTNLDNHERTHTGEKPYFCPECDRSFTSKQVRDTHIKTFHRQNPYACKRCNRRCESKASFIRHMRSHAGITPYECPMCGKKMTTEYSLKMHIQAIHDRKMPFKCEICEKSFPYKSSLTLHMNRHSGGKSYVCDVCGKCFASRGSLRTHIHTHSAEKPYKCEWCDKSYSRKDLLAGHKLQIHGIQPEMSYSRLTRHH